MIFSSTMFLFRFLPIFFILYFGAPLRMKNIILLLGSLFFYAWGEPQYVLLLLILIFSDYCHGRFMGRSKRKSTRLFLLCTALLINVSVFVFFRFLDAMPLGMCIYLFQSMSYIIDCYRGKVKVQTNLLDYAMYVSLFAQMSAGPIVKYAEVEKQLHERKPDVVQISHGCSRFIVGLAKKVLLADQLGLLWADISARDFGELTVLTAWLGILAFGLQIYFELSGFADMAIGLGACLGFVFPENFRYPYIATSVSDFWCRWNMTLTGWLREYVYLPLGGKKKGVPRRILNICIVWLLIGIWYGTGLRFLVWGLWFAFWIVLEKLFLKRLLRRLPNWFDCVYTLFIICMGWVVLGIPQWRDVISYFGALFGQNGAGWYDREAFYLLLEYLVLFAAAVIGATPLIQQIAARLSRSVTGFGIAQYRVLEKLVLALLLILSIVYLAGSDYQPFLYFWH